MKLICGETKHGIRAKAKAFRKHSANEKTGATRGNPMLLQSQRDCVLQPRVARHELPWVQERSGFNPNGVVARFHHRATTPLGLSAFGHVSLVPRNPGLNNGIPLGFNVG